MPVPFGPIALGAVAGSFLQPPGRAHFVPIDATEADLGRHARRPPRRADAPEPEPEPQMDPATRRWLEDW